jgi:hypothetical protein
MADIDPAADNLSAVAPGLPLVQMIGQRQRNAMAQRGFGKLVAGAEQDAAVAAKAQFRISQRRTVRMSASFTSLRRHLFMRKIAAKNSAIDRCTKRT